MPSSAAPSEPLIDRNVPHSCTTRPLDSLGFARATIPAEAQADNKSPNQSAFRRIMVPPGVRGIGTPSDPGSPGSGFSRGDFDGAHPGFRRGWSPWRGDDATAKPPESRTSPVGSGATPIRTGVVAGLVLRIA